MSILVKYGRPGGRVWIGLHLLEIYGKFTNIRGYLQFLENMDDDGGYSPLFYINIKYNYSTQTLCIYTIIHKHYI